MNKNDRIHEHYVLRSGLDSLRALMNKKNPLENLISEQIADEKAVANKDKYYRITAPDDIHYEVEWDFIKSMKAKYAVLPDIGS